MGNPKVPFFRLRDESTTRDVRLDRLVSFDERSRSYPIEAIPILKSRVWGLWHRRQLNQGQEGACVSAAIAHELAADPVPINGLTMDWARQQIYWEAQRIDPWDGGAYPGADPRYEGTSVLAGLKVTQALGYFDGYRWAFTDDERVSGVCNDGPAVTGSWWLEGMARPRPSGLVEVSGERLGGHATCWLGVRFGHRLKGERPQDLAVIAQSWGPRHGDKGRIFVNLHDWLAHLQDDGEVAFVTGRHRPKSAL